MTDRGDATPDRRVGPRSFPGLDGVTEQRAERRSDGAVFGRTLPCRADLAEDLMLADDRRVEACRDGEKVPDRLGIVERVEVVSDVFRSEPCMTSDEFADVLIPAVKLLRVGVDLDAIAG